MTEERLQEIKDSVEFQYTLAKAKGVDNALLFTNEEEELIEEVERLKKDNGDIIKLFAKEREETKRLHSIIKEVRELLKNDYFEDGSFTTEKRVFELLDKVEEK